MAATRRQLLAAKGGQAEDKSNTDDLRGTKRKRKLPPSSDGDDSDGDERVKKNLVAPSDQEVALIENDKETLEPAICSCPRNIMTCIGILPSLSIVNQYCDSGDDSDSTLDDDNAHTVLPRVDRNRKGGEEC